MPGTTPVEGDLLQIRTVCYTPQQISMNVLHYEVAAVAGVPLTLSQIALLYETRVATLYKAMMPATARWRGCDVRNLMLPMTLTFPSVSLDNTGTSGTQLVPTQSSYLIRNQAAFGGRKYIGHVYPGFVTLSFVDNDGQLTAPGQAALDLLLAGLGPTALLVGDTGQASLALTIRHPNTPGPIVAPVWTRVASMVSSPLIATQRRRGDYGARNSPPF